MLPWELLSEMQRLVDWRVRQGPCGMPILEGEVTSYHTCVYVSQSKDKAKFIFSPDWSETCLDGADLRNITPYDFTCTDALRGQVTLCARRCDRIEDGCQVARFVLSILQLLISLMSGQQR